MSDAPPPTPPVRPSVVAGALAGLLPAVSFWIFHTLWIADVPAVLAEGTLWGLCAGAAVGWAFHHLHLRGGFAADARGGLLLALTLWILLVPFEILGLAFGPLTHLTRPVELLAIAPIGLVAAPLGALVGWAFTHDRRAAAALALASTLMHFMIGGSLVYFGGRGAILILFVAMLPTYLVAGLVVARARVALLARASRGAALARTTEVEP